MIVTRTVLYILHVTSRISLALYNSLICSSLITCDPNTNLTLKLGMRSISSNTPVFEIQILEWVFLKMYFMFASLVILLQLLIPIYNLTAKILSFNYKSFSSRLLAKITYWPLSEYVFVRSLSLIAAIHHGSWKSVRFRSRRGNELRLL